MYRSTKTFGHEVGISAAFRQWRADSHCHFLHGYALSFTFIFEAEYLDCRNWVVDFGGFKKLKELIMSRFDHKVIAAVDDPQIEKIMELQNLGIAEVTVLNCVGCEAFAQHAFQIASTLFNDGRVKLVSVEVKEHGANSAIYME